MAMARRLNPVAVTFGVLSLHLLVAGVIAFNVTTLSFEEGYSLLFGDGNLVRSPDDRSVQLMLNRYTGSGFVSSDSYRFGLFSAKIKLPSEYTAGVVVAFYTSNGDVFQKTHDELDFEFLGNVRRRNWKLQTNVYGNGSTHRGREERYYLPFDPSAEAHRYSILWTNTTIRFFIDDIPIREVLPSDWMGADYPSKPMSLYATIWDGSTWATEGGKYKVNYKYSPFVVEFSDLVLHGCPMDPIQQVSSSHDTCPDMASEFSAADFAVTTPRQRQVMRKFRQKYMAYSFCYDMQRYPITFPDCNVIPEEKERFNEKGHLKVDPWRRSKRRSRRMAIRERSSPVRGQAAT